MTSSMSLMLALAVLGTATAQVRVVCPAICLSEGTVTGGRNPGDKVAITCRAGYHIEGATSLTCGDDGKWSAVKPICRKDIYCSSIPGIDFGSATFSTDSTRPGGTVTFSCNNDRKLEGAAKLTCQENGKWDNAAPRCMNARCRTIRSLKHGIVVNQDTLPGGALSFKCDVGFKLSGSATLKCGDKNEWDGKVPVCEDTKCDHIAQMVHGSVEKYNRLPGSEVTVKCDSGYKIQGSDKIKCGQDGKWGPAVPTCRRDTSVSKEVVEKKKDFKSCPFFNLKNGECRGKRIVGRSLTCSCEDGYTLEGASAIKCTDTLKWDKSYPTCVSNQCAPFQFIQNGKVKPGTSAPYTPGNPINVLCDDGFVTDAATTMTCGADLKWSHITECKPVSCPHIPYMSHGTMLGYSTAVRGNAISFTCNPSYVREGENSVRCDAFGKWSTEFPKCVPEQTCHVPCIRNGHFVQSMSAGSKKVVYFCKVNFNLVGSLERTCKDGQWSAPAPTCIDSSGGSRAECVNKPLDIFFVVDISKSIQIESLEEERDVVRFLFNAFDVAEGKSRVGLIKYHDFAEMEITMGKYATKSKLEKVHILTRGDIKGGTRTDMAMNMMMDNFVKVPGRDRICILVTDGKATESLSEMITRLEKTDIKTVAVGVGADADEEELRSIATGSGDSNVYSARDFKELASIAATLVDELCEVVKPITVTPITAVLPVAPIEQCLDIKVDVYFVVDISKSIGPNEFVQEKNVLKKLIGGFDIGVDKTRVGLIKFHNFAELEFALGKYATRDELKKVDLLTRGEVDGGTRTDLAMNMMMSRFQNEAISSRGKLCIIVTDGKATADLTNTVNALAKVDIKVVSIGVGKDAKVDELMALATGSGLSNVYKATDFKGLDAIVNDVVKKTCLEL